jgi:predicted transcriptional regulator
MASLIENLITTLEEENHLYESLTKESMAKTPMIVANDLAKLQEANTKEQAIVDQITAVSHRRDQALTEIATVLGKDAKTITVSEVIVLMEKQPEFQHPLIIVRDKVETGGRAETGERP